MSDGLGCHWASLFVPLSYEVTSNKSSLCFFLLLVACTGLLWMCYWVYLVRAVRARTLTPMTLITRIFEDRTHAHTYTQTPNNPPPHIQTLWILVPSSSLNNLISPWMYIGTWTSCQSGPSSNVLISRNIVQSHMYLSYQYYVSRVSTFTFLV